MDLSLLNNASKVTPMLVKLYDSQQLRAMAENNDPAARAELVSAVCELLDLDLEVRESELVADVLIELLGQAERDLRQALSEKLAVMDDVPFRLVLHIANDEIDVAAPILRQSALLGDLDLIYIVKSKTPEYWREIAQRKQLNDQVINVLAGTRDFETGMKLVENEGITLTDLSMEILSDLAQGKDELAGKLLRRAEMREDLAKGLYELASEQIKSHITQNYSGLERKLVIQTMDLVMEEKVDAKDHGSDLADMMQKETHREAAERLRSHGALNINTILKTLQEGQMKSFVSQLACYAGLEDCYLAQLLTRKSGQGLAIICRANSIMKQDFISIFLLTHSMRGDNQSVDTAAMNRAVAYYNKLSEEMAKNILSGGAL